MFRTHFIKTIFVSLLLCLSVRGYTQTTNNKLFERFETSTDAIDIKKCKTFVHKQSNWKLFMPKDWRGSFHKEAPGITLYNKTLTIISYTVWDVEGTTIPNKINENKTKKIIQIDNHDILMIYKESKNQIEIYYQDDNKESAYVTFFTITKRGLGYTDKDLSEIKFLLKQYLDKFPSKK